MTEVRMETMHENADRHVSEGDIGFFCRLPPEERERSRRQRKEMLADAEFMRELMSQVRYVGWPEGYDPATQKTLDDWN